MSTLLQLLLKNSTISRLVISIFLVPCLNAQPLISSIAIRGNTYFTERELLQPLPLKVDARFSRELLEQSRTLLLRRYLNEGFYAAVIDSIRTQITPDSTSAAVSIFLSEGTQSLLADVRISGNTILSTEQIYRFCDTKTGAPLRQEVMEEDIETILGWYDVHGYPLASVSIDSVLLDPDDRSRLLLHVHVKEGPAVVIQQVKVEGNTSTKDYVVMREVRLSGAELYNEERIDRIRKRIERLGIFSAVSRPLLFFTSEPSGDTSRGGILIAVQEGNANNFDGIVGYVPSALPGEKGYFTGNIFIGLRNLFGTGRRTTVRWVRENQYSQEVELTYFEPWIAGYPLNGSAGFFQRKQDSTYIKTRINLRTDFLATDELSFGLFVNRETIYPSSSMPYFTVFESDVFALGAEIRYDTRDNLRNPTDGVNYTTAYERGEKNINGPAQYVSLAPDRSITIERISLDFETFFSLFPAHVLMGGIHARQLTSKGIEQSDLFQFGGTNTLRGYRENQFAGSQIVWTNLEYRFFLGRTTSVFGFLDGGFYSRPRDPVHQISAQENMKYGYGVGARVETGLGQLRISYALGAGDSFSAGKIHFGIANDF
jgi:outer membrane protein assembly factor BamA